MEEKERKRTAGRSDKRHYAMKAIRPKATQAIMYCAVAAGAVYFAIHGGAGIDIALAAAISVGALGYTAFYALKLSKTYYSIRTGSLIVATPDFTHKILWDDIDYALYDASSKSIEVVEKNGTSVLIDQYDDLRVLTQGLDMRGVRLEYKRMSTTIMDEQQ